VTAGLVHTCAIDGTALYCWGGNYDGQLGEPTLGNGTLTPQPIAQTQAWSSVSAGYVHTCAIEDVTGDLYCWGDGRHGQLGNGAMSSNVPVHVH
jgi:alpha-tubulin suppressor-like RCC1 family protein